MIGEFEVMKLPFFVEIKQTKNQLSDKANASTSSILEKVIVQPPKEISILKEQLDRKGKVINKLPEQLDRRYKKISLLLLPN